jgi:FkbM family methyltransferase
MARVSGFLKPCYVFAPRTLLRRVRLGWSRSGSPQVVQLPWGATLEVNPHETVGRELLRQNVFDIAVSETVWRLLKSGDVAVDAGANIGYVTTLLAARVGAGGRVEAFEPHPRIFARLRANAGRAIHGRSAATIRLHQCALGSRDGSARLSEPTGFHVNEGAATLAPRAEADANGAAGSLEVRLAKLDTVLGDCEIALLKVDVEGFEAEVFRGAERLLARHRIKNIIYEAHECERSHLHELMVRHGYTVFGIGYDLFGLRITAGTAAPKVDRAWESPSYLATLNPHDVVQLLGPRGWRVLHAGRKLVEGRT